MIVDQARAATAIGDIPRDTVEEFWDLDILEELVTGRGAVSPHDFADCFTIHFGLTGEPILTTSARAGLCGYLRARRDTVPRDIVLVAAFNCRAVADAVRQAGLVVATFDADPAFGAMAAETVEPLLTPQILALVVPHLFGVPSELRPLLETCRRHGIAVIEDCSQTVGAALGSHPVGDYGDAAIFSFGYDKPLSLGGGGLLVVRDGIRVTGVVGHRTSDRRLLTRLCSFLQRRRELIRVTGETLDPERRRHLYAEAANAPVAPPIGPVRAALGMWQLARYADVLQRRNANAALLASAGITTWRPPADARPAWLKQKVLLPDQATAVAVTGELQRRGLRAGPFNWSTIVAPELASTPLPVAARYAAQAIDVPIHQRVSQEQVAQMIDLLRTVG